jgi:hypothetical protein
MPDVRRLYRYIWMLYGLLMTVFGAQQILRFLFYVPGDVLGEWDAKSRSMGWPCSWSGLRSGSTRGAHPGLPGRSRGNGLDPAPWHSLPAFPGRGHHRHHHSLDGDHTILNALLGQEQPSDEFIQKVGGPHLHWPAFGLVWAYYGYWLNRHIEAVGDRVAKPGMKRLYNYILAFIGLVVAFVGVATLLAFLIDMLTGFGITFTETMRDSLASAISSLIVGLPLWLAMWRPMQAEALAEEKWAITPGGPSCAKPIYIWRCSLR